MLKIVLLRCDDVFTSNEGVGARLYNSVSVVLEVFQWHWVGVLGLAWDYCINN